MLRTFVVAYEPGDCKLNSPRRVGLTVHLCAIAALAVQPSSAYSLCSLVKRWPRSSVVTDLSTLSADSKTNWQIGKINHCLTIRSKKKVWGFSVDLKYQTVGSSDDFSSYSEAKPKGELLYAIPIRVQKCAAPQALVCYLDGAWAHFRIFALADETVSTVFTFAVRDLRAIDWKSRAGTLESFVVYDRWDPKAVDRERPSRPGKRWQRIIEFSWDAARESFRELASRWQEYDINGPSSKLTGQLIDQNHCDFRFLR